LSEYLIYFDVIGTIAFALAGYILASKAKLDILGILLISYINAFGGGIARDMLADKVPFIFSEAYPIKVVFITIVLAYVFRIHKHINLTDNKIFIISDAIGLNIFAFTGAIVGIQSGFNFGGVVFLAFITAVGGGMLRDIMMNKIPYILHNEFYGSIAVIVGIMTWFVDRYMSMNNLEIVAILIFGFTLRVLAIKYRWKLSKLIDNDSHI
jgi:uncharacterized membrane protein YeiH